MSVPHNKTRGWLYVMLPYDRDDSRNFYTIEFRTPENVDKGIGQVRFLVIFNFTNCYQDKFYKKINHNIKSFSGFGFNSSCSTSWWNLLFRVSI